MGLAASLPILQGSGHAYTNVVLNGVDLRLILDTGSAETIVSKAAAKRLGLSLNAAGYAYGVGGSTSAYVFEARSFRIGRLSGTRLPLLVSDFDFPIGALKADGLLGVDFLSAYDLDLDFKSRQARLFKVVSGCSSPAAVMAEPLYFAKLLYGRASPTVQVRIGNETVVAVVDTGAPDTAMFRGAARRLGLISEAFAAGSHEFRGGIGRRKVAAVHHIAPPLTIGEVTIAQLPITILDQGSAGTGVDMLLGMDFLTRVHTWFSFSSHTLIMQYPPRPSPPTKEAG